MSGKITAEKISAGKITTPMLILPGNKYCRAKLENPIHWREAPDVFENIFCAIGSFFFFFVKSQNP